jgi:hypothetical protein
VKEIELEGYTEPETAQKKDTKQTAAVDLSKRLKDFRSLNDASSLKGFSLYTLQTFLNYNCLLCAITSDEHRKMDILISSLLPEKNLFREFFNSVLVIISSSSSWQTVVYKLNCSNITRGASFHLCYL